MKCAEPSNDILLQAACAQVQPAANLAQEAVYWTTIVDSTGQTLNGQHDYVLHFPAGQTPPNNAFWSITMEDAQNHFVVNPINRYDVSDRSGLVPNADGSIDIYIQNTPPAGHETDWRPAPTGNFMLWLRVYLPSPAILNGTYQVPTVMEAR